MRDIGLPKIASNEVEIERCFKVLTELRPHLIVKEFLALIREMEKEGYQLAFIKENNEVVCVAGFRICTNLFKGKNFYVDDLVTAETHRSCGYGETMISWLKKLATKEKCNSFSLDSGVQRDKAHKFYFEQGLTIIGYHFNFDSNQL